MEPNNTSEVKTPPNPSPEPPHSTKRLIFGLLFSFLIVLLAGAFLVLSRENNKIASPNPPQNSITSPTPTSTPTKTYTITETANGNLFTENKYGFSFIFPKTLREKGSIGGASTESGVTMITTLADLTDIHQGDYGFDGFSVNIVDNPKNLTFDQYIQSEKDQWHKTYPDLTENPQEKIVYLDGQKGIELIGYNPFSTKSFYFPTPNKTHFIVFGKLGKTLGSFDAQFNQILSTFKFTNSLTDYSPRKTYKNQKYNFMFDYPASWKLTETGQYGAFGVDITSLSGFQVSFGTNEQGFGGACNSNSFGYNSSGKINFMGTQVNSFTYGKDPNQISKIYLTEKSIPCDNIAYFIVPELKGIKINGGETNGVSTAKMQYLDYKEFPPESFFNSDGFLLGNQILSSFKTIKQ